ncbi:lipid-A-disaccharide synthase [bacterium]|nr:lipid-A-disaccharide synthase [bacterium]
MNVWQGEEVKVFISAGEASGDLYGSYLTKAIKKEIPRAIFWGLGGHNMAKAGVSLLMYSTHKGAIGVVEALKILPSSLIALFRVKKHLATNPPHILILINAGAFNLRVGRWVKKYLQIPILYFIPPGSWKRQVGNNVIRLKQSADKFVCIFPWNQKALREKGLDAYFFGHPLLDILHKEDKKIAREKLQLQETLTLGLLPGSRLQEIRHILPTLLQTVPILRKKLPRLQFVLAPPIHSLPFLPKCLPKGWRISQDALVSDSDIVHLRIGQSWEVMNASDALIVTSGTATLESAIFETPLIVIYKGSPLSHLEYHLRALNLPFISLPNIILDRKEFPELIQEQAIPPLIANLAYQLLTNQSLRDRQFELFREIKRSLGDKGAFQKTALLVKKMVMRK